jgi:ankyrin repeat protein
MQSDQSKQSMKELFLAAIKHGDLDIVKFLIINREANVNMQRDEAIILASQKGHIGIIKYLHSRGANIYVDDDISLREACKSWSSGCC